MPVSALATSGACSFHNGVNCSAGADINGKVKCNDGWVNSSVYFSNTDECQTNLNNLCPLPYLVKGYGSTDMSFCDQYQTACDTAHQSTINALLMGGADSSSVPPETCPDVDECRRDVTLNNNAIQLYNQCLEAVKQTQASIAKVGQEKADAKLNQLNQQNLDSVCQLTIGINSYSNPKDGLCYCSAGYFMNDVSSKCMLANEANYDLSCKEQFGELAEMTIGNKGSCSCPFGYEFNSAQRCEKTSEPIKTTENPVVTPIVKPKPKTSIKSSVVVPAKIVKEPIKTAEITTPPSQAENITIPTTPAPIKKLKWYQKIFNWFLN